MSNILGERVTYMSFGESHGPAVGAILDGISAGIDIDCAYVQRQVDRRKPQRQPAEPQDAKATKWRFFPGIYRGKTLGTPIGILIRNTTRDTPIMPSTENLYRPNHADYTWQARYGHRDHRGGGRASARGDSGKSRRRAIASQVLATAGVKVKAWTQAIGSISTGMDPQHSPATRYTNRHSAAPTAMPQSQ